MELDVVAATVIIANNFILRDSTRQGLPGCAIITHTQLEKTQQEGYSKHKSSDLASPQCGGGGEGAGTTRQPNAIGASRERQTSHRYSRSDHQILLFHSHFLLKFALVWIFFLAPARLKSGASHLCSSCLELGRNTTFTASLVAQW